MSAGPLSSRDLDKIVVRLPQGMRSRLSDRAKQNLRSVNAEVVMILAGALKEQDKAA